MTCEICVKPAIVGIGHDKQHGICGEHWVKWWFYRKSTDNWQDLPEPQFTERWEQEFARFIKEQKHEGC